MVKTLPSKMKQLGQPSQPKLWGNLFIISSARARAPSYFSRNLKLGNQAQQYKLQEQ